MLADHGCVHTSLPGIGCDMGRWFVTGMCNPSGTKVVSGASINQFSKAMIRLEQEHSTRRFFPVPILIMIASFLPSVASAQAADPGRPGQFDPWGSVSPVRITMKAFPNPFDSWVNVQVADCIGKAIRIEITSFPNGQVVLQQDLIYTGPVLLNTTQVPFGNHILSVRAQQSGALLGSREVQRQAGP